ncbi:MAG: hypothetical protein KDC87_03410 [Planctomycetes bacterium]|nr:hypothetical protein [Planctomycetota bacterium]MCB9871290.1 hypothetical protein [Planctomycetota bacterium]
MMARAGIGGISVEPNPAAEGGTVTVTGPPDSHVYVGHGGKTTRVKLGRDGKAKVAVPGKGGQEFTVTDGNFPKPKSVVVEIVATGRAPRIKLRGAI